MERKELEEALKKVACGFSLEEITEEYAVEDGEVRLVKRKETHKDVPPDLKAVKLLLDGEMPDYAQMTDEELKKEKERLLSLIKEKQE